ncbi:MAG TPA: efflux RND transporter periplasmic adaptor subunit [Burkholderiales bacterium]|nr:efflux RND transporter periplasmic adaptor subunit [Burkholderiales bacterium]
MESGRHALRAALRRHAARGASLVFVSLGLAAGAAVAAGDAERAAGAPAAAALDAREIRAQLTPRRYTTLAAEIGAKVNRIPVPEGGRFSAGDTLVSFDCTMQQAQLDKARATLVAAEKVWSANKRLRELNSVGAVELDVSAAEAEKARAEVASGQAVMSKCAAHAPFAGRVAEQKVREQQYVQPGQALLEILDDSELELEFIVPSRWLAWVKPGHAFRVSIDETGKTYPARVRRIGARVDPVSQSIKLSAVVDGRFSELVAGMSGRVLMAPPRAGR